MCPEISVIIPVFNGEKTLERSLESVSCQTFADFECIIVNDGSKDNTASLLADFAQRDSRFRVVTIPNGGVSHAKNTGLDCAVGRFWAFLDCDDVLEPHALETLHHVITDTNSDVAIAHIVFEDEHGDKTDRTPALPTLEQSPLRMTSAQAVCTMLEGHPFGGHLHAKLLRAETMKSLRYREDVYIFEDMLFLIEAFTLVQSAAYTPDIVHHYRVSEDGALAKALSERKASSLLACAEIRRIASIHFPEALILARDFAFRNALWVLEELAASPVAIRKQPWAQRAGRMACAEIQTRPNPANLPWIQRLFCSAIRLGWPIFYALHQGPYKLFKKLT